MHVSSIGNMTLLLGKVNSNKAKIQYSVKDVMKFLPKEVKQS